MNSDNVDKVIKRFHSYLPLGNNYSDSVKFVGESEEQRIERILENKLQAREQKQKTSIYQTNIDSLSIDRAGKK